jgi:uncharacterized protein YidB (DUF937 family)
MGLFGDLVGELETQAGQHAALYEEVAGLVTQSGGVNGLLQQFEQNGAGHLVAGWMGGAVTTPVSADQIIQVIGQERIAAMAARVGLSEPQVAEGMAKILPVIVSHLSSNGVAPSAGSTLEAEALGVLKSKLFGS